MNPSVLPAMACMLAATGISGCASGPSAEPSVIPVALNPPAGQVLFLETLATGAQVYECAATAGTSPGYAWRFVAPEATLTDRSGVKLGKHYAGPTWESVDGSKVVGSLVRQDAGPTPSAIPWLLLTSKGNTGQA